MLWIVALTVAVTLAAALTALLLRNFVGAVAAVSVVSVGVSVLFVLLRAPDVAMTEAVVGAGLGGFLLALGLKRLGLWRIEVQEERKHGR